MPKGQVGLNLKPNVDSTKFLTSPAGGIRTLKHLLLKQDARPLAFRYNIGFRVAISCSGIPKEGKPSQAP
jgi:hypothetical protein